MFQRIKFYFKFKLHMNNFLHIFKYIYIINITFYIYIYIFVITHRWKLPINLNSERTYIRNKTLLLNPWLKIVYTSKTLISLLKNIVNILSHFPKSWALLNCAHLKYMCYNVLELILNLLLETKYYLSCIQHRRGDAN